MTCKTRRRMPSEHRSRLAPDFSLSNLSLSVHILVYVPEATPVVQWPPLPTHVKAVLNFGIQVPF